MTTEHTITDLSVIAEHAREREEENEAFYRFMLSAADPDMDARVHAINKSTEAIIDCTACGNCCKNLMINVTPPEIDRLGVVMNTPAQEIKEKYIEESMGGQLIMNTIPCNFLAEKKCTIYEHRFTECRDFPHLHKPGFMRRFSGTILHYGTCPIIFNVIEQLKVNTGFDANGR